MNRLEHILTITGEECNEVAQRISKALRFGMNNIQEGQPYTNAERIMMEYMDLVSMMDMLREEMDKLEGVGEHPIMSNLPNLNTSLKKDRVEKYLEISKKEKTYE